MTLMDLPRFRGGLRTWDQGQLLPVTPPATTFRSVNQKNALA
jgi:hypothetical protein